MTDRAQGVADSLLVRALNWTGRPRPAGDGSVPAAAPVHEAASLFKALGHEGRLLILCHLASGEKSVNELENILDARQSAVSQQLARLRMENMVTARREGQMIYYSISDPRTMRLLAMLGEILDQPEHPRA